MSSIMKGIVDEGEEVAVIYIDGKPSAKYAKKHEAERDAEFMRSRHPNKKIEIKHEVRETEAKKGADGKRCWKGKRYAGTENGKDKCIPVNENAESKWEVAVEYGPTAHDTVKIKVSAPDEDTAQNKALALFKKKYPDRRGMVGDCTKLDEAANPAQQAAIAIAKKKKAKTNEGVFDLLKKKPAPRDNMRERLSNMSTDELRQELKDYKSRLSGARASGSLVGAAVSDYINAIKSEIDKRAFNDFSANTNEGVIVGHDANDPEVAILGGAGTMSLSRLKKKAQGEAEQLANDLTRGRFKAAAYNIKQLENTLKTIVAAEDEMSKKYFGEDCTGEFAAEKTAATNPYGGQKERQFRGAIGEARAPHPLLKAANKNLVDLASGEVRRREASRKAAEKGQKAASKYLKSLDKKPSTDEVWRKIEDAVANSFPDGDPYDMLWPWLERNGLDNDDVVRAARKQGYKDLWDYWHILSRDIGHEVMNEMPDTSGPVGTQPGGWHRTDLDEELSRADVDAIARFADKLYKKLGIDVTFTKHFMDRVNDERNGKPISGAELVRLFKKEYERWGKQVAQLGPDVEGTFKDLTTDINLPFVLRWDRDEDELDLVAKTVMRKKNFKTWNKEFPVDEDTSYGTGMGQGGNAGESYRKFKPKSAGTFKESAIMKGITGRK